MLVYLAGPEVFLPNALAVGKAKKALCVEMGFQGLFPFDNEIDIEAKHSTSSASQIIYRENVQMMRRADLAVFNLTPFRGPSADVGTVYELGFFIGLGKPAFGYSNDGRELCDRVFEADSCNRGADGVLRDAEGLTIENFGNADNLMIDCGLVEQTVPMIKRSVARAERYTDLCGFRACLEAAQAHLRGQAIYTESLS